VNSPPLRTVRSYVLRSGRKTESQQRAYEMLWPRFGLRTIDGIPASLSPDGHTGEVVLEIGFGMGDSLAEMASCHPETFFIGIEVHKPGVGRLMNLAEERGISNLRIYAEDALEVLEKSVPDHRLSKVQLFFPDPWPKKKHHKRRIVQPSFARLVQKKLRPGGVLHMATDWQNYAEQMMEVMSQTEGFANVAGPGQFSPRPSSRPATKFEQRGLKLGHGVWDLLFSSSGEDRGSGAT
jgi:tRNA (guanine-N7-)-methyltransferase